MYAEQTERHPNNTLQRLGLFLVALSAAILLAALVIGATNAKRASPRLCIGSSVVFEDMTVAFDAIQPVAGQGYTALETALKVSFAAETPDEHRAQRRQYHMPAKRESGAALIERWNGRYSVQPRTYRAADSCMLFDLEWQPLRNWLVYGVWLLVGGLVLALVKPLVAAATASRRSLNVTFALFVLLAVTLTYWLLRQPAAVPPGQFTGGGTLIKVRDTLLHDGRSSFNRWIIMADAMTRRGQHVDAVTLLRGATDQNVHDPEAWLALGDALYAARPAHLLISEQTRRLSAPAWLPD
jgi:Cytochrome c-type biogenesis protein CcmF C-terminal/Tetratricopeptide repeat